jgi:hypothetical protein
MNVAYRLYLGARNHARHAFSPQDLAAVEAILGGHFLGWTSARATGCWRGRVEETLVITVTSRGLRGEELPARERLAQCAAELKDLLGQESVMVEEGGAVRFF